MKKPTKKNAQDANIRNKLIVYRSTVIVILALILVLPDHNAETPTDMRGWLSSYAYALIVALVITLFIDKYIVRYAKTGSLKK